MLANLHLHHDKPVDAPLIAIAFSDLQLAHPSANLKLCSLEISQERDKLHLMAVASPQADLNALRAEYFARLNHLISLFADPNTQNLVLAKIGKLTLNLTRDREFGDRLWHQLLLLFSTKCDRTCGKLLTLPPVSQHQQRSRTLIKNVVQMREKLFLSRNYFYLLFYC